MNSDQESPATIHVDDNAERQHFERFAASAPYRGVSFERGPNGEYLHPGLEGNWTVWRASAAVRRGQVNTSIGMAAAQGPMEDFSAAVNLVGLVARSKTNGEALGHVLKYRKRVREGLLEMSAQLDRSADIDVGDPVALRGEVLRLLALLAEDGDGTAWREIAVAEAARRITAEEAAGPLALEMLSVIDTGIDLVSTKAAHDSDTVSWLGRAGTQVLTKRARGAHAAAAVERQHVDFADRFEKSPDEALIARLVEGLARLLERFLIVYELPASGTRPHEVAIAEAAIAAAKAAYPNMA